MNIFLIVILFLISWCIIGLLTTFAGMYIDGDENSPKEIMQMSLLGGVLLIGAIYIMITRLFKYINVHHITPYMRKLNPTNKDGDFWNTKINLKKK